MRYPSMRMEEIPLRGRDVGGSESKGTRHEEMTFV
jgi:hypothetical protein